MGQREEIIKIARAEIGFGEGRNNKTKYGAWYGLDNNPWCAMFVSWCAAQAGISTAIIPKFAYVPDGVKFFRQRGRYKESIDLTYTSRPGDIVFFGTGNHVGIVEKVRGNTLITIEGNTSPGNVGSQTNGEGVYRRERVLRGGWTMGYGVPAYEGDAEMKSKDLEILNTDTKKMIIVQALNIEDTNYVRLRDLEKLFPVIIGWNGKNPTMRMNYK